MIAASAIVAASVAAAASAIATVVIAATASAGIAAIVRRAVTAKSVLKQAPRSNDHGNVSSGWFRWWCWRWRRRAPAVLPAAQDLPVLRRQCAEDRLQGHSAPAALHLRARQDRAEPDHRGVGQEAA